MTAHRICEAPDCDNEIDPELVRKHDKKTCNDSCRAKAWKARVRYGHHPDPIAHPDAGSGREGRANARRAKPAGLQVSYRRAVGEVAVCLHALYGIAEDRAAEDAREMMRGALSEKQRARLDDMERT